MDFFLALLNANWSGTPLLICVSIIVIEYYHHNDLSLLISRLKSLDIMGNKVSIGGDVAQGDAIGDTENAKMTYKNDMEAKENETEYKQIKKFYEFEKIYNVIYGTQLQMLEMMKRNNNQQVQYQFAYNFFLMHQNLLPLNLRNNQSADMYFEWLENSNLIKRDNDSFVVTEYGMDFLAYIYMRNYNWGLKML